jgi:hypothetical protein
MISTMAENKMFFTNRQLERAKLKAVLRLNMIKYCLVVEEDIILAEKIFGKAVAKA